jgi:hypothetical protein
MSALAGYVRLLEAQQAYNPTTDGIVPVTDSLKVVVGCGPGYGGTAQAPLLPGIRFFRKRCIWEDWRAR